MYNFKATTVVKFISIGLGVFEIYYETKGGVFFLDTVHLQSNANVT